MILNLKKSLLILAVLPKTGSVSGQLIVKDLAERVTKLQEELKQKTNFVLQDNGWASFDATKDEDIEFALSAAEIHELKRGVKALDEAEQVTLELVDICKEIEAM